MDIIDAILFAAIFAAALIHFLPKSRHDRLLDAYVGALDHHKWKDDQDLYEEVLGLYPKLNLREHNEIVRDLLEDHRIETRVFHPQQVIRETEAPNHIGRTHIDHIEAFSTISTTCYRRANFGGKKNPHRPFMSFRFGMT